VPFCGADGPLGAFCGRCGARLALTVATAPVPYRPSLGWTLAGVAAWIVTLIANLPPSDSTAFKAGAIIGTLIFPVLIRIGWVCVARRGPYLWHRALFSPWLWAVATTLNVITANGRHPGGG
jgi:hypothetical protein